MLGEDALGVGKSGGVAEFIPRGIFYNGCLYSSTAFNEPLPIWAGDKRGRLPDGVTAWQAGRHVEGAGEGVGTGTDKTTRRSGEMK